MQHRFDQLHMQVKFWEGHHALDPECVPPLSELSHARKHHMWDAHAWSVLQGHLMIMRHYLMHSDAPMLCVLEDDVHVRRDFMQLQPVMHAEITQLDLDVCMLGYLTPHKLVQTDCMYAPMHLGTSYLHYPENVYGTQMYVMRRAHVRRMWDQYGVDSDWHAHVFSHNLWMPADWIITKQGRRACVYPLMAVEEQGGGISYQDPDQTHWHQLCHQAHYDPDLYV